MIAQKLSKRLRVGGRRSILSLLQVLVFPYTHSLLVHTVESTVNDPFMRTDNHARILLIHPLSI